MWYNLYEFKCGWNWERIQTGFNFWDKSLRLVPQNASCELFVGQSLRPVPSCKLFSGIVAGTSRLMCADLNTLQIVKLKYCRGLRGA